jgi:O-acetyl-ADP-ribose deacetylase (regulator of RNase III)
MLKYIEGDATDPVSDTKYNIIVHVVNDEGVMGAGIARTIREKWPHVYSKYVSLFKSPAKDRATAQGQIQIVRADGDLFVCNLFGQSGIGPFYGLPAVRYGAIEEGLLRLNHRIATANDKTSVSLHMPRIGCGLAGGSWAKVQDVIERVFEDSDIPITVYDYPGSTFNP